MDKNQTQPPEHCIGYSPHSKPRGTLLRRLELNSWLWWLLAGLTLCGLAASLLRGAPPLAPPLGVRPTPAIVELGRALFFDPLLSANGTISCSTCHQPEHGGADGNIVAIGIFGQPGNRNSPTVINAAYSPLMFHDGRTIGLAEQATQPIENPLEMGRQTFGQMLNRLRRNPGYVRAFVSVYGPGLNGNSPINRVRYQIALASFQQTLLSFDAPIDRRLAGDVTALSPRAEIGFGLAQRANCFSCHQPPLFTTNLFANNGMEFVSRFAPEDFDQGRAVVDGTSIRQFKVPALRELARTAPYSHSGRFADVLSLVRHYGRGGAGSDGRRDPLVDRRIQPQNWTDNQERSVVAFLSEAFQSANYPEVTKPILPR